MDAAAASAARDLIFLAKALWTELDDVYDVDMDEGRARANVPGDLYALIVDVRANALRLESHIPALPNIAALTASLASTPVRDAIADAGQ